MRNPESGHAAIFLVDDHPAVRQGLSMLFSHTGFAVCGEAGSIAETLAKLDEAKPDIVLVDISLENESGLVLLEELTRRHVKSIVYSMHGDAETIEKAFKAGAGGYITKRDNIDSLVDGVDDVMAGRRHLSFTAARILAEKVLKRDGQNPENILSERELAILRHIRRGKTTSEISEELHISPRTVESYYGRMIEKLKLSGMKALRHFACRERT